MATLEGLQNYVKKAIERDKAAKQRKKDADARTIVPQEQKLRRMVEEANKAQRKRRMQKRK